MQCNKNFSQSGRHDARLHHGKQQHQQQRSSAQPRAPKRRPQQQQNNKQAGYLASATQAAAGALARVGVVVTEVSSGCQLAYVLHSRFGRAHRHLRQASLEEKLFLCVFSPLLVTLLVEEAVVRWPNLRDPLHVEILQRLELLPKDFSPPVGCDMPVPGSDASNIATANPAPPAAVSAGNKEAVLAESAAKPCLPLATNTMTVEVFCGEPCAAPASPAVPNASSDAITASNITIPSALTAGCNTTTNTSSSSSNSVSRANTEACSFLVPQPVLFHGCSASEPDMAVLVCQGSAGSETEDCCCLANADDDTGSTSGPTPAPTPGFAKAQVSDPKLPLLHKLGSFFSRKQQDGQDLTTGRGIDTQPPAAASAQPSASAVSGSRALLGSLKASIKRASRAAAPKAGAGTKAARFGKAFAAVCACGGAQALQQVL